MTVDTPSVLTAFTALSEFALGALACVVAARILRRGPGAAAADDAGASLAGLTAWRLVAVAAVSVPLLFLVLRASVATWPGVMCVAGVLRVGEGSSGPERWLPSLIVAAFALKALVVLAGGGWATMAAVARRTATGPAARRATVGLALTGALALADATATSTYLVLPKQASHLARGCCTTDVASAPTGDVAAPSSDAARAAWTTAFFTCGGATCSLLGFARVRGLGDGAAAWWAPSVATGAVATAASGAVYASSVVAPLRLGRPLHECTFCLLDGAPETWVGAAALAVAVPCAAWAATVAVASAGSGASAASDLTLRRLSGVGAFGFAAALAVGAAERWAS